MVYFPDSIMQSSLLDAVFTLGSALARRCGEQEKVKQPPAQHPLRQRQVLSYPEGFCRRLKGGEEQVWNGQGKRDRTAYTHTIVCCEQPGENGRFVLCCRWIPLCPSFSEMSAAPLIRKIGNMRGELKRLAVRDSKGSGRRARRKIEHSTQESEYRSGRRLGQLSAFPATDDVIPISLSLLNEETNFRPERTRQQMLPKWGRRRDNLDGSIAESTPINPSISLPPSCVRVRNMWTARASRFTTAAAESTSSKPKVNVWQQIFLQPRQRQYVAK